MRGHCPDAAYLTHIPDVSHLFLSTIPPSTAHRTLVRMVTRNSAALVALPLLLPGATTTGRRADVGRGVRRRRRRRRRCARGNQEMIQQQTGFLSVILDPYG